MLVCVLLLVITLTHNAVITCSYEFVELNAMWHAIIGATTKLTWLAKMLHGG